MEEKLMVDQVQNTTQNDAIIPEHWSAKTYEVNLQKNPFIGSITYDYEGEIRNLGDTVNIHSIPEFDDAGELGEMAAGEADSVLIDTQQLVINKRVYKDYIITDNAQLQSLAFTDKLRDKAVFAIQKRMQALIIADIVPSASSPDHTIAFDSGTTLALADILEAKELLDEADVDEDDRVCVLGSAQINDIFNITGFISRDYIPAGSPLTSGKIQTPLAGFTPKLTTAAGNTSYFFHPMFMGGAVQKQLSVKVFDLGAHGIRAKRVNIDILMGLKQLDDERVVTIG
jgi:hypothetical protein